MTSLKDIKTQALVLEANALAVTIQAEQSPNAEAEARKAWHEIVAELKARHVELDTLVICPENI